MFTRSSRERRRRPRRCSRTAPADDGVGGLLVAFLEGFWKSKKQAVDKFRNDMVGHAKNFHTSLQTNEGRKGLLQGAKNHLIHDQKKLNNWERNCSLSTSVVETVPLIALFWPAMLVKGPLVE